MRKRALHVEFVKPMTDKTAEEAIEEETFEDKAAIVGAVVNDITTKVVIGVATYVALDTIRKVVIASTTK